MPELLERRVDTLEDLVAELARADARIDRQIEQTDRQIAQTDRQLARTDRQLESTLRAMAVYGARLEQSIADAEKDRIERRREWGELSQRLGTMAEDLVAPSIPRILRTVIGCPDNHVDGYAVRVRKWSRQERREREFDVVATCGDYLLINETKTRLTPADVKAFVALLPTVREHFFPEHPGKRVIGALASLYVDESLVRHGERQGLIILGFGEDLMDVLNSEDFVPREF